MSSFPAIHRRSERDHPELSYQTRNETSFILPGKKIPKLFWHHVIPVDETTPINRNLPVHELGCWYCMKHRNAFGRTEAVSNLSFPDLCSEGGAIRRTEKRWTMTWLGQRGCVDGWVGDGGSAAGLRSDLRESSCADTPYSCSLSHPYLGLSVSHAAHSGPAHNSSLCFRLCTSSTLSKYYLLCCSPRGLVCMSVAPSVYSLNDFLLSLTAIFNHRALPLFLVPFYCVSTCFSMNSVRCHGDANLRSSPTLRHRNSGGSAVKRRKIASAGVKP
jgi:hypothetical protein